MKYITILARNVYFDKNNEEFFDELTNKANTIQVKKYIKTIRNYLINEYKGTKITKVPNNAPDWLKEAIQNNQEVFKINFTNTLKENLRHYIDYLNWYSNNNPNKDIKFSFTELVKRVRENDKKQLEIKDEEDGTSVLHEYTNGYKWVKVFGKNSLIREGNLMGHCVGKLYQGLVNYGKSEIYSLRDNKNEPHCTIEYVVKHKKIEQIQGKQNTGVVDKYIPYVQDFINSKYIEYKSINNAYLIRNDMVYYNNKLVKFSTLDKYEDNTAELDIFGLDIKLPKVIQVKEFNFDEDNAQFPEKSLIVLSDLDLYKSKVNKLPEYLEVRDNLDLSESYINIMPSIIKVSNDLDLSFANVNSIPDAMYIGGNLFLKKSNLTKLPNILEVGEGLYLGYTKITELPDNLKVGKDLVLSKSKVIKLPDNLKVDGVLNLIDSKITQIPDNLSVGSSLKLSGTKISKLPKGLKVGGDLFIDNTKIKELPDDLEVRGQIYLDDDKFESIKCNDRLKQKIHDNWED